MSRRLRGAFALVLVGGAIALSACGASQDDQLNKDIQNIEQARRNADRAMSDLRSR